AAQKQLAALQRYTSSERTGGDDVPPTPPPGLPPSAPLRRRADSNWEELRKLWYANTGRLEAVIEKIADGRKKLKYDRMPRTNYSRIINALASDELISEPAKDASIKLNNTFMSFKRSQQIPDDAIGALKVLDRQLDEEIGKAPPDDDGNGA